MENRVYVKNGVFPKETSKIIRQASEYREKADYLDFFVASKDEAEKQIKRAEEFRQYIAAFLTEKNVL